MYIQSDDLTLRNFMMMMMMLMMWLQVLMGFLQENTPASELPLLISFEAKSLGDAKFKLAKLRMEALGYAVSKFANDGFALLRGDRMFQKQSANMLTKTTTTAAAAAAAAAAATEAYSQDVSPPGTPDEKETAAMKSSDIVQESISSFKSNQQSAQVLTTHFGAVEGPEEDKEPI